MNFYLDAHIAVYNDNTALIPQLWANESIAVLEENMVMGMLVHRDFSSQVASFGDVVNTRKPGEHNARRQTQGGSLVYNDATLTNVAVPLDQHIYNGFIVYDGEKSKAFQDLVAIHVVPSMKAIGNTIDRMIAGRMAHSLLGGVNDRVGRLNNLTSSNGKDNVLDVRERLNRTLADQAGRNLVLAPGSETALLQTELFIRANERGDGGSALEEARLGRILGFNTYMDQNINGVLPNASRDVATGTVTNAAAAGVTASQTVVVTGYEVSVGEYVNMAGNDQPTYATAVTASTNTTAVTLNEELKYNVGAGAVLTAYKSCDVADDYAADYSKHITLDGHTSGKGPVVGQLLAFGTGGSRRVYSIVGIIPVSATSTAVLLDRPLEIAVANNDLAFPGPSGDFNLAFQRKAFALVTRPLAAAGDGARSFVAMHNDIAMRVTMQYDIDVQGTKVVFDLLAGTAVLDSALAAVLLG